MLSLWRLCISLINFWVAGPVFVKISMYILAPFNVEDKMFTA
jgi:hypothetical protein